MLQGPATVSFYADRVPQAARWYADLLGFAPYFERPGPEGDPVYVEFRIGDFQTELGIIDSRFRAPEREGPGGAILYWHVDDVAGAFARLLGSGAAEHQPVTVRGEGFVTASVVDPFGNVLGIMENQHYRDTAAALTGRSASRSADG